MDPYFIYGSDDQTKDSPDALEGHKKLHLFIILNCRIILDPPIVLGLFMAVLFGTVSLFMFLGQTAFYEKNIYTPLLW